ncbi:transposase [Abyssisolibacter fermentans]|uniref:transposase n=1 Tax=Abyssisolibacter fermentans TaxID=1766203 RepID=UPI00083206DF
MRKCTDEATPYYICVDGRKLIHKGTESRKQGNIKRTFEVYACSNCSGCSLKPKCLYKYNKHANKNKTMRVNEIWENLKNESHKNIQSEQGIINRQIRSIQTEGHFGDIKENDNFRRFNYRSSEKVLKNLCFMQ